jgi:hypothetical protein
MTNEPRDPLVGMGPHLRGSSPPFTPSGKAATAASSVRFTNGAAPNRQSGHRGILVRWRADRSSVEQLLPWPLQPTASTDRPSLFLNQTQTGQGREFLLYENPQVLNWHEALFLIPCSFNGRDCMFVWALYKDVDYDAGIALGIYRGFVNKAAHFATLFPFEGQPDNREMRADAVARIVVSRMDEKIIDCWFQAERELTAEEIEREIDREQLLSDVGIRYMPDWIDTDGPPVVHDLVLWQMASGLISRAWSGDAGLSFGDSDADELDLLAPVEMLPSFFIELQYRGGPGLVSVIHDYLERDVEGGRVRRRATSDMGPHLRGGAPPFTPSGRASFIRSTDLGATLGQSGHVGILARFRVDRANAERLLPRPLAPSEHTDSVFLFLNETQSGFIRHRPAGEVGWDYLRAFNPNHASWHEALLLIPCLCEGRPAAFIPWQYKDQDHAVPLGIFDGYWTKLATFHKTFPFGPQPMNSELHAGDVARYHVSRFDERIISAEFTATRELAREQIARAIPYEELLNGVGVRFWPDYARPGAAPLAHDLVVWGMGDGDIPRAWAGELSLSFTDSDYEELSLLAPLEPLRSHFIYLQYRAGPGKARVVHDYVAAPIDEHS